MEYSFLKNIVLSFSTPFKNKTRAEQIILALLSAPKITPFFQVTGDTASKFSKTSVLVLYLYTQDSKLLPFMLILVSINDKKFTLSSTVNLILPCWWLMIQKWLKLEIFIKYSQNIINISDIQFRINTTLIENIMLF